MTYENQPRIMTEIKNGNLEEVTKYYSNGGDINQKIKYHYVYKDLKGNDKHSEGEILPVVLAAQNCQLDVLKYMCGIGAVMPDDIIHSVLFLADSAELIKTLYELGANIEYVSNTNVSLYESAVFNKAYNSLAALYEIGLDIKKFGSSALSTAAFYAGKKDRKDHDFYMKAIRFLVEHGADVNYHDTDNWIEYGQSVLMRSIYNYADMELIKYLINNGADITYTDSYGMRAYHFALYRHLYELAEYLKSIEPKSFHDIDVKKKQLKEFGCPDSMIEFLEKRNNVIECSSNAYFLYITDTYITPFKNKDHICICHEFEDYLGLRLLWCKETKSICYYDDEHEEYYSICSWEDFQAEPVKILDRMLTFEDIPHEEYDDE